MNEKQYTLAQAIEIFVRHSEIKGLAKDTIKSYRLYTTKFAEWIGKETPLSDITINDIEEYMEYKRLGGNKAVSVATNVRNLRCFFNFCSKRKMMEHLEITMPRYEKELKEPYSDYEMALLLVKPKGDSWTEYRNWAMVNYFFATGQRLSTVIHIRVKDVDLVNKRVFLLWNKDKIQKYMPLSTQICRVLQEYIYISRLESEDYLFPEENGKQLQKRSCQHAITTYNKSRGVEKNGIHLFRHTFAKNYILNGGNAVKLQKLLAHKSLETTMKYVNLYANDISLDLDTLNPLDNFSRCMNHSKSRRKFDFDNLIY